MPKQGKDLKRKAPRLGKDDGAILIRSNSIPAIPASQSNQDLSSQDHSTLYTSKAGSSRLIVGYVTCVCLTLIYAMRGSSHVISVKHHITIVDRPAPEMCKFIFFLCV